MFDKKKEFVKSDRNAVVAINEKLIVKYPIENHIYQLPDNCMQSIISDLLNIWKSECQQINRPNFESFLQMQFGQTLYDLYFKPYNQKVWRTDLSKIPLTWLDGKLPMPTIEDIIYNNMNHIDERNFVHSTFYYPKQNGSQFIVDRLLLDLDVRYNSVISNVELKDGKWIVNGDLFDRIVFCGNLKSLPNMLRNSPKMRSYEKKISELEYHGTTTVLCEIDQNDYSWVYLPSKDYESHRIICTGNFAPSNSRHGTMSATIEFTDYLDKDDIIRNLNKMPFSPKYICHNYEKYTYPIQHDNTKEVIKKIKSDFSCDKLYILGRFAEWEYFNMDMAMDAAWKLCQEINS